MTSTALAIDSAPRSANRLVSIDISRPRPTKSLSLPSRLRLTSNTSRSPRRNDAGCRRGGSRSARRAGRPPCRRAGSRPAPSRAAGACRCRSPRRPPTRPRSAPGRSTTTSADVGERGAHAQRAARGARRLVGRLAGVGQRHHDRAVGQRVQRARRARCASSSSSAASRRTGGRSAAVVRRRRRRRDADRVARASGRSAGRRRTGDDDAGDALLAVGERRAARAARRGDQRRRRCIGPSSSSASMTARHVGEAVRRAPSPACAPPARRAPAARAARSSRTRGASCSRIFASSAVASSASNTGAPGQALEQHAAQREHVGAGRDVALAAHQLGRHVAGRADHRAGARQLARAALREPRDAEVEHLEPLDRRRPGRNRFSGLMSRWMMPRSCA